MQAKATTPARLAVRLAVYFACVIGTLAIVAELTDWSPMLPIGGHDVNVPGTADEVLGTLESIQGNTGEVQDWSRLDVALVLITDLASTVLLMIPITWVYIATKAVEGYSKAFVRALIVLPICATSIVLLIQDSLALAFGLAALVAAVQFRVRLRDALDGIYVFAAICVGLASGVSYVGVAVVMTIFFCFAAVILWGLDYGENPIEQEDQAKKLTKLRAPPKDLAQPR